MKLLVVLGDKDLQEERERRAEADAYYKKPTPAILRSGYT